MDAGGDITHMRIAFAGDVHGRIFHALAALSMLRERDGAPFDLIVQVGDLGYPDPARADAASKRYLAVDPAEADLARLMEADGETAACVRDVGASLGGALHFVRGNHEDFDWLRGLRVDGDGTARADPHDTLRYVPDGTLLDIDGFRIAFLGGVEELPGDASIDATAHEALAGLGAGAVDLLVTHEGPYGSSTGYHGDVHGSRLMSDLLAALRPRYHVFGHAHSTFGPTTVGATACLGLDALVASVLWHPEARGLKPGCLAVLDNSRGELRHVTEPWLAAFPTPFDFEAWARGRTDG
jgi:Icc-related predicted phosphoesterase